jgi:ribosomal silencing factor RsfS
VLLTTEEIRVALEAQGAEDVRVVSMKFRIESISHLVIASGRSTRHLAKMSHSIVQAVRPNLYFIC